MTLSSCDVHSCGLLFSLTTVLLVHWNSFLALWSTENGTPRLQQRNYVSGELRLLLWKKPFGFDVSAQYKCHKLSPYVCKIDIAENIAPIDYNRYVAVVVHHIDSREIVWRKTHFLKDFAPLWIWWTLESRSKFPETYENPDGFFHKTATFRRDSDIFTPYARLVKRRSRVHLDFPPRPLLVAWYVSNYSPEMERSRIVSDLSSFIQVDIYGRAENANHTELPMERVLQQYRFYLAFENSRHEDYITEKLWENAFTNHLIPVVLGPPRDCYEKYIPASSFIHVDDFATTEQLARHISEVAENETLWTNYLKWHEEYEVQTWNWIEGSMCFICNYLHDVRTYNYSKRWGISNWFL